MVEIPDSADIVIIGGGVIGLSVACHLAWRSVGNVVLLERHQLTSGTSWHAAGIIGPLRASMNLTRLSVYAIDLFARLERETGLTTGYRRTGGLWLAQTADRMTELHRTADMGLLNSLDARMMTADEVRGRFSLLETHDLAGGLWVEEDGQANPVDVCMAYAKAARTGGVRICEGAAVRTVVMDEGKVAAVEMADGRRIGCRVVVNCAGAWAHNLGATSGISIPLQAVEHMYVVTEPVAGLPEPTPIVRDLDGRIYIKSDAGRLVIGGFEPNAKLFNPSGSNGDVPFLELPDDWEQFEPFMEAGLKRMPMLESVGIQHFMNGPESFTPDTRQIMGEAPECRNYFIAAGFNSIGIVSSAGAGRIMADWIVDGAAPMDLTDVAPDRFETDMGQTDFLRVRTPEAVASQFEMHWPFKRMKTGRDVRRLPADQVWRDAGAVFGSPAGWERPLWFGETPEEHAGAYSYGEQSWWPAAARECEAARDKAVLIDLSPFAKFEVAGPNALATMQNLCSADVDIPVARSIYTLLLNARGGIEADATVTRLSQTRFLYVGAAPSRRRDFTWLTRQNKANVEIRDVTRNEAVIALMGPAAGSVLRAADGDPALLDLPFGATAATQLTGVTVRAHRVSYIGEFGWEFYFPWGDAASIAKLFIDAGRDHGLRPMGLHTVDACRMEKGFRHWGDDIGPEDTPLETGLGFAVGWLKGCDFIGRAALEAQRREGVRRQLVQFAVEGAHPLLLHDEPIFRDGALVGRTTSGARGFRTGLSICFATISTAVGEKQSDPTASRFEISVAGDRFPLRYLSRPPYDPQGHRMRGTTINPESDPS